MSRAAQIGWIVLILIVGAGLRIWLYQEPVNSDDVSYWQMVNTPGPAETSHNSLRGIVRLVAEIPAHFTGYTLTGFYAAAALMAALGYFGLVLFTRVYAPAAALPWTLALWAGSYIFILTDTRLLPDNMGMGLALGALGALGYGAGIRSGQTGRDPECECTTRAMGILAGLLLWAALSARVTFVFYWFAVPFILWVAGRPWRLLLGLLLGLAIGGAAEALWLKWEYGDPLIRLKVVLGYGGDVASNVFFKQQTWASMLIRYPWMLRITGSAEVFWHLLGILGGLWWLWRWRGDPAARIKAAALAFAFGGIAFGVTRFDPPAPIMQEKVRYYATCAPLFYLAAVEGALALWALGWRRLRQGVAAVAAILALFNLTVISQHRHLARNGADYYTASAAAIKRHQAEIGAPKNVIMAPSSARMAKLFLPQSEGWRHLKIDQQTDAPAYRIIDWRRIHYYARQPKFIHDPFYEWPLQTINNEAMVQRHVNHGRFTDVFWRDAQPLARKEVSLNAALNSRQGAAWILQSPEGALRTLRTPTALSPLTLKRGETLRIDAVGDDAQNPLLLARQLATWSPDGAQGGGALLTWTFRLSAPGSDKRQLTGFLEARLIDAQGRATPLGLAYADEQPSRITLWRLLADPTQMRAVELTVKKGPMQLHGVRLRAQRPDARDRFWMAGTQ
ncbi:hypothetical protein [Magnetofaba australis]|uniref:Glycosyltransferase RgtA/B/C/D-like domain-containing protein n=1 Tax=Magnetofaba australis IT-1 TaxID=1434232 RepID=A0A1Y2K0F4_9PROT|nr:hypothetical protein [Magnetofaba australis]OSM01508.1 hypothetical protein MAIT1_01494 [Magnetofaba australis IT-1]